jgi:stress response protein YsnF
LPNLVETIQEIVKNTNNSLSLADILFGTVTSTSPLKISVEQKLELSEEFLILTKNVKDYNVDVTIDWNTEKYNSKININDTSVDITHNHNLKGKKFITIHHALKNGDKVILIQQMGGQKFLVLDKV